MAEKKNIPQVRLSGFRDDWITMKLGDITGRIIRKNTNMDSTLPLTISAQYGLVDQSTFFNNQVASQNISNYYLLMNGEFAYNKSTSQDYPVGAVKRLDRYDMGVLSTLYILFKPRNEVSSDYLVSYFNSDYWHKEITLRAAEGARNHGLLNISPDDFFDIDINLPKEIEEQQNIGDFLKNVDLLILQQRRKLEKLQALKASMLEKMFPQNGADVPEIRFKGFTGAWEQSKAANIAEYSKGNSYSKSDLTDIGTPIILYGRLYTKYQFVIDKVDTFAISKNGSVYSQGNEVIVPASGETADDIARASAVEKSGILIGGDLNILRPFNFINPLFLALAISNGKSKKELAQKAQGKTIVHIHNSDIQEISILYPTKAEQDQIVSVFRNLDNLITLHQQELNKLHSIKKALLEKMFV